MAPKALPIYLAVGAIVGAVAALLFADPVIKGAAWGKMMASKSADAQKSAAAMLRAGMGLGGGALGAALGYAVHSMGGVEKGVDAVKSRAQRAMSRPAGYHGKETARAPSNVESGQSMLW